MTRLINMDNGGTLTGFCLIDGEEVRYTKTLTTPYGLSRCLLDSLAKVSELAYGEPQLRDACCPPIASDIPPPRKPTLSCSGPDRSCACWSPIRRWSRAWRRGLLLRLSPSSARRGPAAVLLGTGRRPPTTSAGTWSGPLNVFLHPAAYRDAMAERVLRQDQARSARLGALLEGRIADTATVWEAADLLGLPYQGVFIVVAAEIPALARHALPQVENRLHGRGIGSAWQLLPELQVGIVSLRSQRNIPALVEILGSGAAARVGVSPVYTALERTSQALHLARIALASSPAGDPMVNVFEPVLVASSPTTSYRVTTTILGPLLDINPDERDMLLDTLAAFFAFQGSAIEAGKHLYCHPNTVRHRLRRIERQTGRPLNDPRSSAELFVALAALRTLPGPVAPPEPDRIR